MLTDTLKMKPYEPSMLIDLRTGREMEVETIFGNPLRAAQKAGEKLPLLEWLYKELSKVNKEKPNDRIQRKRMV
jgi:2-dehydropantoate 2-reductase